MTEEGKGREGKRERKERKPMNKLNKPNTEKQECGSGRTQHLNVMLEARIYLFLDSWCLIPHLVHRWCSINT
jgi:hypothetical protein